ncbi:MAG: glycosyltransferase family 4 protein [Anaerolineaceae bacterium]|nr:glycosyltransferase family 4 protein [Anaerolineaceae bacterium]
MTRKKILHVLEATVGGTRRHLLSLAANLNNNYFQVEVAAPKIRHTSIDDTSFVEELSKIGIPHHYVDMSREIQPFSDLKSLWTLTRLIHQKQYDLVHVHSSKAGFLGRIAAKLNKVPTVYTPNGFYFLDASSPAKEKFYLLLEQIAGKLTDKLIAVSPGEGEQAVRRKVIPPKKLVLIPNAISIQDFEPDKEAKHCTKTKLGIPADSLVVGTVSRYIPQKNPLALVHIFAHIHQAMPDVCFLWCGEGELREDAERLAKDLDVFGAISFLGFRNNIKDIMNTFDIFILASVFEGLPYTILEAMALALPVIATDVVGSRDVVKHGETGFLVPISPDLHLELAQSVTNLLRNEAKRIEFGRRGRELVKEKHSIAQMVEQTEDLYWELLKN